MHQTTAALLAVVVIACCCCCITVVSAARPHILLVIADDYGWNDIGYRKYNKQQQIQTPNNTHNK